MTILTVPKGISNAAVVGVPKEWSSDWFRGFIREHLSKVDVRNAIPTSGIDITGTPNTQATLAVSTNGITASQFRKSAALSVVGNPTGVLANVVDITETQLTAMLNQFTTGLKGVVPGSGGGTTNFLRADGTWATPPSATPAGSDTDVQFNSSGAFAGNATFVWDDTNKVLKIGDATNNAKYTAPVVAATAGLLVRVQGGSADAGAGGGGDIRLSTGLGSGGSNGNFLVESPTSTTTYSQLFKIGGANGEWTLGAGGANGTGTSGQALISQGALAAPSWGNIPAGANPTASLGLAAINGVATTFMRSDAAPALSVSIAPTWTGAHIHTPGAGVAITVNAKSGSAGIVAKAGGATDNVVTLNGQSLGQTCMALQINGTLEAQFGVAGTTSQIITGSAANDVCLRTQGGTVRVSTDSGSTTMFQVTGSLVQGKGAIAAALVDMTPDTGTFTGTFTGLTAVVTTSCTWRKIGKIAVLTIVGASGTSNATTFTMTGLPAAIQPAALVAQSGLYTMTNNSGSVTGAVQIANGSGTVTFLLNGSASGWTASGTKSAGSITFTYLLD